MSEREDERILLVEERSCIDKQKVITGRVRVWTSSSTIEDVARATLSGERVEIVREHLNREIEEVPETRVEGDVTIIPVVEERLVMEKRLFLIEKIHIRRVTINEEVIVPVTLRKQTATVERTEE
ncbi:DUF2382 domain-containing protein [Pararhizobium gei]|uniref:DUF2382 domain-containing protein n=1 Tax=Pararhizobium gei TaxID=1395951 RepID=UPI0023DA5481|nr:DUF2382 domain-containing protein [Rhizobium gei]